MTATCLKMNGIDAVFSICFSASGSTVSGGANRTARSDRRYILLAYDGPLELARRSPPGALVLIVRKYRNQRNVEVAGDDGLSRSPAGMLHVRRRFATHQVAVGAREHRGPVLQHIPLEPAGIGIHGRCAQPVPIPQL